MKLQDMARAAMRDERLSDGALYGKLADAIDAQEETLKMHKGSYLLNCLIVPKKDQEAPMFTGHDDIVSCKLDGYAIVPRDEYHAQEARIKRLEEALRECLAAWDRDGVKADNNSPEVRGRAKSVLEG